MIKYAVYNGIQICNAFVLAIIKMNKMNRIYKNEQAEYPGR